MNLDPNEVLREVQSLNSVLFELAVQRVMNRKLEEENVRLTEALGESHVGSIQNGDES